jgi:hypothetical protein
MAQRPTQTAKTGILAQAPHGCGRCNARWGGLNTSHCSGCHETFTSLSAFDAHRTGSHANGTRTCLPPTKAGLVQANRPYPCWGTEGNDRWNDERETA